MKWTVLLFETNRKEKLVETFIKDQTSLTQAKILHQIELLELYGPRLGMPHSRSLLTGLYELRIRGKEEIRIFYCFQRQTIILLHAFKKQSQKTPSKEINLAVKRKQSLL